MRITLSLPDAIARRFLAVVPSRERSAIVARLLEQELAQRDRELGAACQAANADTALAAEVEEWQGVDDVVEEPPRSRHRSGGRCGE